MELSILPKRRRLQRHGHVHPIALMAMSKILPKFLALSSLFFIRISIYGKKARNFYGPWICSVWPTFERFLGKVVFQ